MFGRRRRQRKASSTRDAITALVEAESAEDLAAAYRDHPLFATEAGPEALANFREVVWQHREFALVLASEWRAEFLYRAAVTGPEVAAEELFSRIAWLDRYAGTIFLVSTVQAIQHLILTHYPYPLRYHQDRAPSAGKQDLLDRVRSLPATEAVPFVDADGTPITDEDRWLVAASLAWDISARDELNELDLACVVLLSTIGLAQAPRDAEQVERIRQVRLNAVLAFLDQKPDDRGALDWAIFTAEEHLRTKPADVIGMNTMHNLCLLLPRRGHEADNRRADELSERMAEELTSLGDDELTEFHETGQVAHVDEAIGVYEHALRLLPPGSSFLPGALSNIANACRERYDLTRDDADIVRAIHLGQQATELLAPEDASRPGMLSNLGLAYQSRFVHQGQLSDIDTAVEIGEAAVSSTPQDAQDRAKLLSDLAKAHTLRMGIAASDQVMAQVQEEMTENLETARLDGRTKEARQLEKALSRWGARPGRRDNLDRAIELYAEAVSIAHPDDADQATYLSNHAYLLQARAVWSEGGTVANEGVEALQVSLSSVADDDPRRSGIAYRLGAMGDTAMLKHAATLPTGPAHIRLRAAREWGDAALNEKDLPTAVEAYGIAVEMLERVAWGGRDRDMQEAEISGRSGLASDAAAVAIRAGQLERAVELLEQGRSLLWGQLLHLRGDLTRLAEIDPELAAALAETRNRLDRPLDTPLTPGERLAALDTWDGLMERVRALPGFETFLRPVRFTDLQLAVDGSVVIINTSALGCDALIVTRATTVHVITLTVTAEQITEQAQRLRTIVGARRRTPLEREKDRRDFLDILEWLWHAIAEPVLTGLGHTGGTDAGLPRLWWCPTGPLTTLPLHAAGVHTRVSTAPSDPALTVAGRVVSSYTPTLAALARPAPAPPPRGCLIIGVATAPGKPPLPAVQDELDGMRELLPDATYLIDADATSARVRSAITEHSWVHLACHADQDQHDAANSAFALWDRPLTLAELTGARTAGGALAYLAACNTATGAIDLADEALHLAGTLQTMGYRQVVTTLWTVNDAITSTISFNVYKALTPGEPHPQAARALHAAVESIRARHPAEPTVWAPFLHTGR